jgi:hypothetical protein
MKPYLVLLFLTVLFLATPIQNVPAQSAPLQDPSDSAQQVSNVLQEWSKDWKARDADSISALYSQDAIVYPAVDRRVNPHDAVGDFKGPVPSGIILGSSLNDLLIPRPAILWLPAPHGYQQVWHSTTDSYSTSLKVSASRLVLVTGRAY